MNGNQGVGTMIEVGADKAIKELQSISNLLNNIQGNIDGIAKAVTKTDNITKSTTKNLTGSLKNINLDSVINNLTRGYRTIEKLTKGFVDYVEDLNLLKVAFGDTADEAKQFVENIADITGYDEATLVRMTATFRQLTSTLGLANKDADLLSKNLSKMALDISSLYNLDLGTAQYALQGALTAQPRSIKTHTGADITQDTLQAELARLGIDRKVKSLNQAENAIITYLSLERQLINSNGDLARTIEQPANMLRVFTEQIKKAGRSIGNLFIPVIQTVIPYLTAFLMVFNEIVSILMGIWGVDTDSFWKSMSAGAIDVSNSFNTMAESANNAKKAQMGLRGFDKLNVIKTPSSSGGAGGGASFGGIDSRLLDAMKEYDLQLDKIKTKATEVRDAIMQWLGFTRNANGEWEWSAKLLGENILKSIKSIFEWLVKNWKIVATIGAVIGTILIVKKLKKTDESLGKVSKSSKILAKATKSLADGFKILAIGIGGLAILGGLAVVIGTFNGLLKTMSENSLTFSDVGKTLGVVLLEIATGFTLIALASKLLDWKGIIGAVAILGGLAIVMQSISDLLKTMSDNGMTLGDVAGTLGAVLGIVVVAMTALMAVATALSSPIGLVAVLALTVAIVAILEVLKDTLPTILEACGKFIEKIGPVLIEILEKVINGIERIIYAIGTVLPPIIYQVGEMWSKIFKGIADVVDSVFGGINTVIKTIGNSVSKILNSIQKLISNVLKSVLDFINQLGPAINNFVDNAIRAVTKLVNFLVSAVEFSINTTIVSAINKIIEAYNGSLGDFFEWLGFSAKISKMKKVSIERFSPKLYADGGFPNTGEMFIAREKGPELVGSIGNKTAVANNQQIVDAVSQGVTNAILASGGFGKNVVIEARGDASGLMNFITFKQKEEDMQYGN